MSVDLSGPAGNVNMSASAPGGTLNTDNDNNNNDTKHFVLPIDNPMINSAANVAGSALERGVAEIRNFVEQNPSSVRATIFTMAFLEALYCLLGVFNVFTAAFTPIQYLINIYILLFACVTLVLEGKHEWPFVAAIQEKIFFQAHFLSQVHGRAFFYVFQGTFGMALRGPLEDPPMFIFGLSFLVVGLLIIVQQMKRKASGSGDNRENLLREFVPPSVP